MADQISIFDPTSGRALNAVVPPRHSCFSCASNPCAAIHCAGSEDCAGTP